MQLIEISPFIRFANDVIIPRRKNAMYCTDCRLIFITEGEGKAYINEKVFNFSRGTVLLWQPYTLYKFTNKNNVKASVIDFDFLADGKNQKDILPLISQNDINKTNQPAVLFKDAEILNSPIVLNNALFLQERINQIINEFSKETVFGNANASAYLKLCIIKLVKTIMSDDKDSEIIKKINFITEYIHENFSNDLSNEKLAKLSGYHPYYLNRIFKEKKGCSLHRYILNYRLSVSAEYLLSTALTLPEIAEKSGFNNQIAFISAFKKKYNLTPTEFRKKTL